VKLLKDTVKLNGIDAAKGPVDAKPIYAPGQIFTGLVKLEWDTLQSASDTDYCISYVAVNSGRSHSCPHPHSRSRSHTHTHTHTRAHAHAHTLTLTLTLTLALAGTRRRSHAHSRPRSHAHTLTLTLTLTLALAGTRRRSHAHSRPRSHAHSRPRSHTHTLTLTLTLAHSHSHSHLTLAGTARRVAVTRTTSCNSVTGSMRTRRRSGHVLQRHMISSADARASRRRRHTGHRPPYCRRRSRVISVRLHTRCRMICRACQCY
jgi:hypothetical protein